MSHQLLKRKMSAETLHLPSSHPAEWKCAGTCQKLMPTSQWEIWFLWFQWLIIPTEFNCISSLFWNYVHIQIFLWWGGEEKLAIQRRGIVLNFNLRILRLTWEGHSRKRGQEASAVLAILGNVLKISALHLKKKSQRQKFPLIPNSAPHPTSHLMAIKLYGCLVPGF